MTFIVFHLELDYKQQYQHFDIYKHEKSQPEVSTVAMVINVQISSSMLHFVIIIYLISLLLLLLCSTTEIPIAHEIINDIPSLFMMCHDKLLLITIIRQGHFISIVLCM